MKPQIGIQLYTLRSLMETDFLGTIEKVAKLGYQGLEFAGYGNLSARDLREAVTGMGLKPVSTHLSLDALETQLDQSIEYALELGLSYIVCPALALSRRETIDGYKQVAESLAKIGEKCAEHGLTFGYHNHAFEFEVKSSEGEYALDFLYSSTPEKAVQAELDIYWVEKAGLSAVDYVKKYAGRIPLLHLKDMAADESRTFSEVGNGILDLPSITAAAEQAGVQWFFVEQDICQRDPLESVTISMENIRKMGLI